MTKREIANLCCRVLAILTIIDALAAAPYVLSLAVPFIESSSWTDVLMQVMYVLTPVILFASGLFLWGWSGLVAAWIVGHDLQDSLSEPDVTRIQAQPREIHAIAFSILGVWILIDAGPKSLSVLAEMIYAASTDDQWRGPRGFHSSVALIELILRLAIGIWLLFGASGLVKLIWSARHLGLEPNERPGGSAP